MKQRDSKIHRVISRSSRKLTLFILKLRKKFRCIPWDKDLLRSELGVRSNETLTLAISSPFLPLLQMNVHITDLKSPRGSGSEKSVTSFHTVVAACRTTGR